VRRERSIRELDLSAGTIQYEDTGGHGPVVVLLHGLMMDASLWRDVIADLAVDHRCVAPVLLLGAHRYAIRSDADLSLRGMASLVAELLDRLDLDDVTLVGNDTGGAIVQLLMSDGAARVGPRRTRLLQRARQLPAEAHAWHTARYLVGTAAHTAWCAIRWEAPPPVS
jgi:pimeloyl-ACP methyl ester carboxylesterase